jgi:peptidoglycan/LPS O-acetylase OafA/YrhL
MMRSLQYIAQNGWGVICTQNLCKTLLLLSIILAIIAMATPDWTVVKLNGKELGNRGLFKACGDVSGDNSVCMNISSDESDVRKATKHSQGLTISAAVFLTLSLACSFIPQNELKHAKALCMALLVLGMVLMVASVVLYATKVPKNSGGISLGYSYYLAIGAIVLAVAAGVCEVAQKDKPGRMHH